MKKNVLWQSCRDQPNLQLCRRMFLFSSCQLRRIRVPKMCQKIVLTFTSHQWTLHVWYYIHIKNKQIWCLCSKLCVCMCVSDKVLIFVTLEIMKAISCTSCLHKLMCTICLCLQIRKCSFDFQSVQIYFCLQFWARWSNKNWVFYKQTDAFQSFIRVFACLNGVAFRYQHWHSK